MNLTHGYILLLMLLVSACRQESPKRPFQDKVTNSEITPLLKHVVSSDLTCFTLTKQDYNFVISPSLANFIVELIFDPNTYHRTILISKAGESAPYQIIDADVGEQLSYGEDLRAVDVNFDGYKDLVLLGWFGATGNKGYSFYIFDSLSKTFILNTDLGELESPRFDDSTKLILTHSVGGMAGNIYRNEIYKYENGKLKLIHAVYQDFDQNTDHFVRKTKHMRNGQLKDSTTIIFPAF